MSDAPEVPNRSGSLPESGEWWVFSGTTNTYPCIGRVAAVHEEDGTYFITLEDAWVDDRWPREDTVPLDDLDYLVQEVGDLLPFACQGDLRLEGVTSACCRDLHAST